MSENTTSTKTPANKGKKLFDKANVKRGMRYHGGQKHVVMQFLKARLIKGEVHARSGLPRFEWGTFGEIKNRFHVAFPTARKWAAELA